jgi:Flp pilus assembly protein TadD
MRPRPLVLPAVLVFALLAGGIAHAGDLRITLPKRTKPTKVQKLNQEGVRALQKHHYEEARKLFYRAYLIDPDDPFTLNNLGYVAELSGDIDRATRFYDLAAQNTSDATIARSTSERLEGRKIADVAGKAADKQMQVNRYNVQAMSLLQKDRAPEADLVLEKALQVDPHNPFTLNNLGYTKEKEGELEQALAYYSKAANTNSTETVVVAANKDWRGRPISEVAAENIRKLRRLMARAETPEARVARLNLEGVSAMNRNDRAAALKYFREAYRLDPDDAFTLNNMGYVAEMEGDRETADFYYAKAAEARGQSARVAVATRREAEGKPVGEVAHMGDQAVSARMEALRAERARQGGPILLMRRNNTPVIEPDKPVVPAPENAAPPGNAEPSEVLPPLPDNQQPPVATQPPPKPPKN